MLKKNIYSAPEFIVLWAEINFSPLCDSGVDASLGELTENDFGEF